MVIVGLGNPGKKYEKTRHNIGFMFVDEIAKVNKIEYKLDKRHQAMIGSTNINGQTCYLIKPITFMNLSGNAVRSFVEYYNIPISDLIIVFDDMDLPLGKLRIRKTGSSGGHKGMKSIIENLGTSDILRIRIGIDKPINEEVVDYVLHKISKKEQIILDETLQLAPQILDDTVISGVDYMMNKYNGVK